MEISLFEENNELIPLGGNPLFSTRSEALGVSLTVSVVNKQILASCGSTTISCCLQRVLDHDREICLTLGELLLVAGYIENGCILVYDEVIEVPAEV